jgi:hypothetical protein
MISVRESKNAKKTIACCQCPRNVFVCECDCRGFMKGYRIGCQKTLPPVSIWWSVRVHREWGGPLCLELWSSLAALFDTWKDDQGQDWLRHTVPLRKPDSPAFKWPSLGHFLCPAFKWLWQPFCIETRTNSPDFEWSGLA